MDVHEPIELSFGMFGVVGLGIGVLDGGRPAAREEVVSWGFNPHSFHWVSMAYLLNRNLLDSCVKS